MFLNASRVALSAAPLSGVGAQFCLPSTLRLPLSRATLPVLSTSKTASLSMSTTTPRTSRQVDGVVSLAETTRFVTESMVAVGTSQQHARDLAEVLAAADYKGHFSHGLNRLEMYVNEVQKKTCDGNAKPVVLKETAATAWVDGNNGLGPVVGNFCMAIAMRKAEESGVGWVVAKGSNHYGIASWYSTQALQQGLLGMSLTNTSPLMSPTGAKEAALGTNPLSLAAPGVEGDSMILDMSTTAVAVGKIEIQRRKHEPIPDGWAQGPDGKTTTDADLAFKTGCLLPLGGSELTSGYKGYGLGMLVETFCGILGGAAFGPNIRRWMETTDKEANLGQCFIAVDPNCFAPGFADRMSSLMGHLRGMAPADPTSPVLVPGDPERLNMKKVDEEGGIRYHENQIKASMELAKRLGIEPLKLS